MEFGEQELRGIESPGSSLSEGVHARERLDLLDMHDQVHGRSHRCLRN